MLQLQSVRASVALNYVDFFCQLRLTRRRPRIVANYTARHERQVDLSMVAQQQDKAGKLAAPKLQEEDLVYDAA